MRTFGSTVSGPLRPKVEHCSSFHVAVGGHGEAVQVIGRATPQSEDEAIRKKLHLSYVVASVVKQFGHLGWFTGVVQEVWEHEENGFFANINYTDGDSRGCSNQRTRRFDETNKFIAPN